MESFRVIFPSGISVTYHDAKYVETNDSGDLFFYESNEKKNVLAMIPKSTGCVIDFGYGNIYDWSKK